MNPGSTRTEANPGHCDASNANMGSGISMASCSAPQFAETLLMRYTLGVEEAEEDGTCAKSGRRRDARSLDCTRVAPHLSRDVRGTPANSEDRERTPPRIKVRRGTNFGVLGRRRR